MIHSIVGTTGVRVSQNSSSMPYINMSAPSAGMMRYNGSSMEVYDGSCWLTLGMGYANIELDFEVLSLLEWARKKRSEELERERLAETNPTMRDLIEQIKQKEEQLRIVQTLIQKEITS